MEEINNCGDLVESNVKSLDYNIPFRTVHASRGKAIRAEPVSSLYEGRVHHVGYYADLESQQTDWVHDEGESPDRIDALVWALTELMEGPQGGEDFSLNDVAMTKSR